MKRLFKLGVLSVLWAALNTNMCWAFSNTFATTDVGYDLYDLVLNKGLNGPIGWVIAFVLVGTGIYALGKGQGTPAFLGIGSGVLLKALPSLLSTLGTTLEYIQYLQVKGYLVATAGILLW